ncbi:MAG: beta-ketoacyl-[acyl-carrier-protein] synthase family protein [Candidatus Omnitrophota bacterium]
MNCEDFVISSIGIISAHGAGKEKFWGALEKGENLINKIESFSTEQMLVDVAAEVRNFNAKCFLGDRGLRNLDRSALLLLVAAKEAIEEGKLEINDSTTDSIGVCTGTTFSHLWSIFEFDREVTQAGIGFASPVLFPSNVMNAASSHVSIRFNIQGFNTTISTGYTSSLEALHYSLNALGDSRVSTVLCGAVEALSFPLMLGFHKLGCLAGLKGEMLSCPFDKRRNGVLLGEAGVVFCVENKARARERNARILVKLRSIAGVFIGHKIGEICPRGTGLEKAILTALDDAGAGVEDIDYISSCANSSVDLDRIEAAVLKKIFGNRLKKIPVSSIKSMIGETLSVSGALQIVSCIGAMARGIVPPTINYQEKDDQCDIDCVPNKAQRKDVKIALVTSFGPGGYNSACVLEKYTEIKNDERI